ncbi:MAG: HAD hydrolase-like protein [Alphaproteobacteria bacterium]
MPRPARSVLVDLDGTLTDSRPGIIASYHAALRLLGHAPDPAVDLTFVIGPTPETAMARVLAPYGDDRIAEAVHAYRDYYGREAIFDAFVYDGIPDALDALRETGAALYLATAKRTVFARRVLDHFGLAGRFAGIYGSEPGGAFDHKSDLIRHVLATEAIPPDSAVMVGDREHDVSGARANGIPVIGALWGYGGRAELEAAGARHFAGAPAELPRAVDTAHAER